MTVRDNGRFVPGQVNSPGGRYATTQRELAAEIRRRCTTGQDAHQLVTWLWEIAAGESVEHPDEGMVGLTKTSDRLAAIRELLDRGYGKAPQLVEIDATVGPAQPPIDLSALTDEQRAEFRNLVLIAAKNTKALK